MQNTLTKPPKQEPEFVVGNRYVVKRWNDETLLEVSVSDIAPSGSLVKFKGLGWERAENWVIVEKLPWP